MNIGLNWLVCDCTFFFPVLNILVVLSGSLLYSVQVIGNGACFSSLLVCDFEDG
jgi:hypothetical protein